MPITRTAMVDDDGSGTTGTIINNAWKTEFYNQIDAVTGGTLIDVPFNAANFVGTGGMTWTVAAENVATNQYSVNGSNVIWYLQIGPTTLAGTPSGEIQIAYPAGFVPLKATQVFGMVGVPWASAILVATAPVLRIVKLDATPFALGTLFVTFTMVFPKQ